MDEILDGGCRPFFLDHTFEVQNPVTVPCNFRPRENMAHLQNGSAKGDWKHQTPSIEMDRVWVNRCLFAHGSR